MLTRRNFCLLLTLLFLASGCSDQDEAATDRDGLRARAWQEARCLNFGKSRRMFERLRSEAQPHSQEWIEATLGLAVSLHHAQPDVRGDKERAGELYDEVIATCTDPSVLPQALLLRARLADQVDYSGDTPDPAVAGALYERLRRDFPESRQAGEATLYLGHAAAMSGDPEAAASAIDDLQQWIAAHPDGPLVSLQWELIGRLNMYPLDNPAAATNAFLKAEAAGLPPMTQMDAFFWRVANLAARAGDAETAATYFRRIILEQPRSGYGYEAQVRLRELGQTPPELTDPFEFIVAAPTGGGS
ncbi:MAG: tetratricopeptide repeat protein [Planctomycetota bacterium]